MPAPNSGGTSSGFGSTPSTPATPPSYNLGNFYQGGFGQPQQGGQPNGPSFGNFLNAIAPGANASNPGFSLYGTQDNFSPQHLMQQAGQIGQGQGNPSGMARQLGNVPLAAPDQSYLNTQPGYVHYDPSMPSGRGGQSEMQAGWNSGFQPTQLPPGLALQTMGNQWRMVPAAFGGNLGMSQGRGGRGRGLLG